MILSLRFLIPWLGMLANPILPLAFPLGYQILRDRIRKPLGEKIRGCVLRPMGKAVPLSAGIRKVVVKFHGDGFAVWW